MKKDTIGKAPESSIDEILDTLQVIRCVLGDPN